MMKKIKIVAVAVGILLLAGCGKQAANNNQNQNQEQVQNQEQNKSGVVNSIKEAMGLGKTMRCTYKIGDGANGTEVVSYVNGKKYATEMTMAGKKQRMVFDENAMYSWGEGEKQGTKMTQTCLNELNANLPKDDKKEEQPASLDIEKQIDQAMDVKCEAVSSANFSIPNDVNFVDQCEMMKNLMKNFSSGLNGQGMPGGVNIPPIGQ